ncbi:ribose 1,5-bisphosphokinase [Marinobacter sp. LV10R520-4]|uniref:phosphonate metabolism protein/1,5-bisphosphokinase (PRPP-forming) PhnN n=1 Tax=Marinobacter sp. LV10R520-4 TaxID=1761796 RepID=UPI000BF68748|nr:phosphonate metabolism protein/1,5-bisphosphokinase (PRPP-forming) PhnN [Marinobacter sp. LV10R520-4]PFG52378.1 ribose 1,5-bisphosphokinase [Marinobacter sp. LV10R520-4]
MANELIFIIGPSGSGKDTLIGLVRQRLGREPDVCFAHRYITRPASAGGENHIALTEDEFLARQSAELFAMSWHSHGCHYGIGIEVNQWLAMGLTVVVNGSRGYLSTALRLYPELCPVLVDVSSEVLRARLIQRGRETQESIEQRLSRNSEFGVESGKDCLRVDNNHSPGAACERLLSIINRYREKTACA